MRVRILLHINVFHINIYIPYKYLLYILYTYLVDSLFEKPDSWNVLEEEEQLSNNNVPGKKLDYLGKANLLR